MVQISVGAEDLGQRQRKPRPPKAERPLEASNLNDQSDEDAINHVAPERTDKMRPVFPNLYFTSILTGSHQTHNVLELLDSASRPIDRAESDPSIACRLPDSMAD